MSGLRLSCLRKQKVRAIAKSSPPGACPRSGAVDYILLYIPPSSGGRLPALGNFNSKIWLLRAWELVSSIYWVPRNSPSVLGGRPERLTMLTIAPSFVVQVCAFARSLASSPRRRITSSARADSRSSRHLICSLASSQLSVLPARGSNARMAWPCRSESAARGADRPPALRPPAPHPAAEGSAGGLA
jgi:hypothetical protein